MGPSLPVVAVILASAVGQLLGTVVSLYILAIIGMSILSWIPMSYDSPLRGLARVLARITDPLLLPLRRVIPPVGGIDLSPMAAIFGLLILQGIIARF